MKQPTVQELAKMIDHSLLHPTMSDEEVRMGCVLSRDYRVAAACVKPYCIGQAREILEGSGVKVCAVIGFPHGNSATGIKVAEAAAAVGEGALEIDMVVNVGKVKSAEWDYVRHEIELINAATLAGGGVLKVIFENDYLNEEEIIRLCEVCSAVDVAFVKTSTGYGFVKQADGSFNYRGATVEHLKLMREHTAPHIQIKAAGGVRTLDDLLAVRALGVTRVGATATRAILDEATARGFEGSAVQPSGQVLPDEPPGY